MGEGEDWLYCHVQVTSSQVWSSFWVFDFEKLSRVGVCMVSFSFGRESNFEMGMFDGKV